MITMGQIENRKFLLAAEGEKRLYCHFNCSDESWGTGFSVERNDWQYPHHFFNLAAAIREYNAA